MLIFKINCFILCLLIGCISCQGQGSCRERKSCDSCIGTAGCAWCKEKSKSDFQRCDVIGGHKTCPAGDIVTAGDNISTIKRKDAIRKDNKNPMRITPQEINAKLAVGKELTLDLTYRDGTDKELDLYYIMDLSATMEDDKKTVAEQAKNMVEALQKITKNVRLGFGSFIDKPVLPFVSSSQLRDDDHTYEKPYGFRNGLKLTDQWQQFQTVVDQAKISRNLDEPEGTLDALMQAITCHDQIGWRNTSRKLIVVATDGPFHIAGDGKLGGIVRPNDMKCHMENNEYTHSTLLDYPSIGEINTVILQNKVYVIFAVSEGSGNVFNVYKELQNHITQSTAEKLDKDSRNVVDKIRKKYLEISKKVELEVVAKPDNVDVLVYVKCPGETSFILGSNCTNVEVDKQVNFQIKLKLTRCPTPQAYLGANRERQERVVISFFELGKEEKLTITLDYACKCGCNDPREHDYDKNNLTLYCTGEEFTKYMSCGVCNCQGNRNGHACQCSEDDAGDDKTCKNPAGDGVTLCSGSSRGTCKCGRCECIPNYNGEYCQDSTLNCQKDKSKPNVLCYGFDKGTCKAGTCHCNDGYEGQFCECEKSRKHLCVEPGQKISDSTICNGHGTCNCAAGQCDCHSGYEGIYCEVCTLCSGGGQKISDRCQDPFLQDCVRCHVVKSQEPKTNTSLPVREQCQERCNDYIYKEKSGSANTRMDVRDFFLEPTLYGLSEFKGTQCTFRINATCTGYFKYNYESKSHGDQDGLKVVYTTDGTCDKEAPIIWIIIGGILTVLLIGIFGLLIWKLATHLHDTREFKRFEQETAMARFQAGENPLYENPHSEFQNPAYRK